MTHLHQSPIFASADALPAATLPIYPGLGQAPDMLHTQWLGYVYFCTCNYHANLMTVAVIAALANMHVSYASFGFR